MTCLVLPRISTGVTSMYRSALVDRRKCKRCARRVRTHRAGSAAAARAVALAGAGVAVAVQVWSADVPLSCTMAIKVFPAPGGGHVNTKAPESHAQDWRDRGRGETYHGDMMDMIGW